MAAVEVPQTLEYRGGQLNAALVLEDFQDSHDDEEDTRSSHEYLNDLEEEYQARALLAKSKRRTKYFEAKYNKVKAKLALLSSSTSAPSSSSGKNKGLIAETYDWDEEEVSFDDNKVIEVKAIMALTDEERVFVGKESANNGEWVKISIQKVHTLLEMEDNNDRKSFLDYLCIDLNYVEEQRNNLLSKHRNLVQELNTCKEQFLVLKQAKLDLLTMQHVNTEILKENQNLRNELKELTSITEAWLNNNSEVSITGSNKPKLSETEDSTLSNHDTGKHPLPPLEKLTGAEPVSAPKTIKSILKSKYTFKAETLKGITINKPSSTPSRGNKSSSVSKTNSTLAGKLKNVKMEDDPPLAIVMKELNELKLQIIKNKSSYFRNKNSQQVPSNALQNKYKTQFKMNCELCGQNNHLSENCYEVLFCKKCKRTIHKTCDHADFMSSMDINQYHTGQSISSSRSRPSRTAMPFPSCIHCGYNDHQPDDCVYYPICEICGSYDHDTHGHNRIISLRRGIKPRNPQHITKNCKTCGSNVHTTFDYNDIEWFKKREALQAKKVESFKASKTESSNALRSKTLTKSKPFTRSPNMYKEYLAEFWNSAKALENSKVSFSIPTGGIFREVGVNTFRNAIGAHYLPHSSEYVALPIIDVEDIIIKLKKKQREKVVPYTRFLSLLIMHKIKERYGDDEVTLYPNQVFNKLVVFKAPKPSSNVERVPQGTNPGAKHGHKKHLTFSKQPFVSSKEATKGGSSKAPTGSKTGHSKKMIKEDQQATGGPTSLGVTSETRANPQLSSGNDASAASTTEADPRNSAPSDFITQQQDMNEGTKNTSYDHLFAGTDLHVLTDQTKSVNEGLETVLTQPVTGKRGQLGCDFNDLDSPEDDPVIIVNDSDEDEDDEVHATKNSQKYKLELEKNKAEAKAALFKAQPSFLNVEQLKELLEIKLPGDWKEITPKLEDFEKTVTSLTSQVVELKILQWELPAEFLVVPSQVEMGEHIKKDKGKKALSSEEAVKESTKSDSDGDETHLSRSMVESSRIKKVKKFDFVTEDGKHIYLTEEQINQQKKIKEEAKAEATKHEIKVRKEELIDLLGPKVVNKYYNDKLQYDRYCDKMLNKRAVSRITNYDVLTKKGPNIPKVYREDGTSEIILNFKASDMHLGE
ncbi:hypothetical protein Tco_1304646 [Tanacetum coccineum]